MIKKPVGYTIGAIALIGGIFFDNYKGELIPHTRLWLVLSIIVFFIAAYFAFKRRPKKEIARSAEDSDHRNKLIATAEQIKLDIDSCEIKENNYYEEISDHNLGGTELIVAAFDPNENHEEKYIEQSAIIYHHKIGDKTEKYISQTFQFGTEALTLHILNNDIILYVDRLDRNNYLFDFNEKPA